MIFKLTQMHAVIVVGMVVGTRTGSTVFRVLTVVIVRSAAAVAAIVVMMRVILIIIVILIVVC